MLQNIYDLLNESAEKRIKRMKKINEELDEILESPFFLLKRKRWKRLMKEFDSLYITAMNEGKAMLDIENLGKVKYDR